MLATLFPYQSETNTLATTAFLTSLAVLIFAALFALLTKTGNAATAR